jgi:hypothetical protein
MRSRLHVCQTSSLYHVKAAYSKLTTNDLQPYCSDYTLPLLVSEDVPPELM